MAKQRFFTYLEDNDPLAKQIDERIDADKSTMKDWVFNALMKKLQEKSGSIILVRDPMEGLSKADRLVAMRFIEKLRTYQPYYKRALIGICNAAYRLYGQPKER